MLLFRVKWILDEIYLPFRLVLTAVTGLAVHWLGVFSYAISTIPRWRRAITGSHAHPHTEPTWFGAGTPWRPLAPVSVTCKNEPRNLRDKYVSEKKKQDKLNLMTILSALKRDQAWSLPIISGRCPEYLASMCFKLACGLLSKSYAYKPSYYLPTTTKTIFFLGQPSLSFTDKTRYVHTHTHTKITRWTYSGNSPSWRKF